MQLVGGLVEQTAEPVASEHTARVVADDDWTGRCVRRFESERPVGTVAVVELAVDAEHLLKV
jgi:hypothetical protein